MTTMSNAPTAITASGAVQGAYSASEDPSQRPVAVFKGIPYAEASRFGAPRSARGWTGTRDATQFSGVAPQSPGVMDRLFSARDLRFTEDCLALNVYTPAADGQRRPVMVWIHGGGFTGGAGSIPWYDGSQFGRQHDIVVVTINYRLGVLGFTHLEGIADGNAGLLDQVEALRWVAANIEGFGGDPANVTIFGESAGAMSIGALLGMPTAAGLFRRAILQSGAADNVRTAARAEEVTENVLNHLGLRAATASRLYDLPLRQILEAQQTIGDDISGGGLPFGPVIDGTTFPQAPIEAVAAGSGKDVDVIVGVNAHEATLFNLLSADDLDRTKLIGRAARVFGTRAETVVDTYLTNRPGRNAKDVWIDLSSDLIFGAPARRLLVALTAAGGSAYDYLFRWETPAFGGRLRSCHALEIPFVFDNLAAPGVTQFTGDAPERQLIATAMHSAWAAFAHSGAPGPDWPKWSFERRATKVFDLEVTVEDNPRGAELDLW